MLLQFATTHRSDILARTLSRLTSFVRNGFPGRRHRSNSNPFSLNLAVFQNGGNFSNFENLQKIEQKSYDDNFFTAVISNKSTFLAVRKKFGG